MIPYGRHYIDEEDIQSVADILRGGWLTQGPTIEAFEQAVSERVAAPYAIAVSSCTAALHLSAMAAGVSPKRSLITSPNSFVATANAGRYCQAKVHFADIDAQTLNLSPKTLTQTLEASEAAGEEVGLVAPVHFTGLPCKMQDIQALVAQYSSKQVGQEKTLIVEDAAHALGASYTSGEAVGSCTYSDFTCFSFHPVKAIAAGEGGLITTKDEGLYRDLLRLRSHGINKLNDEPKLKDLAYDTDGQVNPWYYEMRQLGYHYRITDIQCALAVSQLKKLNRFLERRKQLYDRYFNAFKDFENLRSAQPYARDVSGHHIFVVRINFDKIGLSRRRVMLKLREKGIGSQVHYIPITAQPYYQDLGYDPKNYPNSWAYYQEALSIPFFYELTDAQQDRVIEELKTIVG